MFRKSGLICVLAAVWAGLATPAAAAKFVFDVTINTVSSLNYATGASVGGPPASPLMFTMSWDVASLSGPVFTLLYQDRVEYFATTTDPATSSGSPLDADLFALADLVPADAVSEAFVDKFGVIHTDPAQNSFVTTTELETSALRNSSDAPGHVRQQQVQILLSRTVSGSGPSVQLPSAITLADVREGSNIFAFSALGRDYNDFSGRAFGQMTTYTGSAVLRAAAVPEPGAWALMILGFGAAGATLRRRPILA